MVVCIDLCGVVGCVVSVWFIVCGVVVLVLCVLRLLWVVVVFGVL